MHLKSKYTIKLWLKEMKLPVEHYSSLKKQRSYICQLIYKLIR